MEFTGHIYHILWAFWVENKVYLADCAKVPMICLSLVDYICKELGNVDKGRAYHIMLIVHYCVMLCWTLRVGIVRTWSSVDLHEAGIRHLLIIVHSGFWRNFCFDGASSCGHFKCTSDSFTKSFAHQTSFTPDVDASACIFCITVSDFPDDKQGHKLYP